MLLDHPQSNEGELVEVKDLLYDRFNRDPDSGI